MIFTKIFILLFQVAAISGTKCQRTFFIYHHIFGNGFQVECQDLHPSKNGSLNNSASVFGDILLKIQNSVIDNVNVPKDLFNNLESVKELVIRNCTILNETVFSSFKNIEHIFIYDTKLEFLKNLPNVKFVRLENNTISKIPSDINEQLPKLEKLEIVKNNLRTVDLAQFCSNFSHVRKLNFNNNFIQNVHIKSCQNLKLLNELNMDYNKISNITFLNYLPELRILSLQNNFIKEIKYSDFHILKNLIKLNLNGNKIVAIEESVFKNMDQLQFLYLENNKIANLEGSHLRNLRYLNLGNNLLKKFTVVSLLNLEELDLSYNNLNIIPKMFLTISENVTFTKLEKLNLANNNLQILPGENFSNLPTIQELDLGYNKIFHLQPMTLKNLRSLQVLNLTHNYLETFPFDVVQNLDNLKKLDLSDNSLEQIDYKLIMGQIRSLKLINIKDNDFKCEILMGIIQISKKNNVTFSLNKNWSAEVHEDEFLCQDDFESIGFNLGIFCVLVFIFGIILLFILLFNSVFVKQKYFILNEFELVEK